MVWTAGCFLSLVRPGSQDPSFLKKMQVPDLNKNSADRRCFLILV
jgi:hypothetical protein